MEYGQNYAINIEHILCDIFECEVNGFGGIINSDYIKTQPFTSMFSGLAFLYGKSDNIKKREIEKFVEENIFYSRNGMSIDELLSFDKSNKIINGVEIDIGYKNGKEAIEKIIKEFKSILR